MTAPTEIIWVEPDLPGPSGGSLYNTRVIEALGHGGTTVRLIRQAARWPRPTPEDRTRLMDRLAEQRAAHPGAPVIVDGLIGAAMPELFAPSPDLHGAAVADVLLVHLPLAAEHEHPGGGPSPGPVQRSERRAVAAARRVVATSRWAADDLRRRHGRQDVDVIIPGVARPGHDHGGRESGRLEAGPWRLTMAASFTPRKNHRLLGAALAPLMHHDWVLQLAGAGGEGSGPGAGAQVLAELQEQLPDRVVPLGALDAEAMHQLWRRTDLLLLPSWVETYGMVVTEACVHGVPGLVSSGSGAVEALGEAGASADPSDPQTWTRMLQGWMTDPGLRGRWAAAARRRADSLPSWEQSANRWRRLTASLRTG